MLGDTSFSHVAARFIAQITSYGYQHFGFDGVLARN
jgi:hypothetical protein